MAERTPGPWEIINGYEIAKTGKDWATMRRRGRKHQGVGHEGH
jgi:hypothetical protein